MEFAVRPNKSPTVNFATGISSTRVQGSQYSNSDGSRSCCFSANRGLCIELSCVAGSAEFITVFMALFPRCQIPIAPAQCESPAFDGFALGWLCAERAQLLSI